MPDEGGVEDAISHPTELSNRSVFFAVGVFHVFILGVGKVVEGKGR